MTEHAANGEQENRWCNTPLTSTPEVKFATCYAEVLGVRVSALNMEDAVRSADQWISAGNYGYACASSVHGIMEAQSDPRYREILNSAALNLPDGMPLTWVGHLQGHRDMDRVFGPDFMLELCRLSVKRGYRNFLYGGRPGVAEELRDSLLLRFPGLQIVGTYTPPFRDLNLGEEQSLLDQVHDCQPHILWVGISTPRQERFMAQYVKQLRVPLMVGVGAAFDFHTGRIRDCSHLLKRAGLQWLHRLAQDPKRLSSRYMRTHPAFLWQIAAQFAGVRDYGDERS
jgi:N-acetylglucosaminyldiphosphoundecaprenol N-acetyl-beta-D-mannosaminyltransferase